MHSRQQTAVEFIMTYGWAIVAVVVALGVMYSLGIFGLGSNGATGCSVLEGFSCTKPILYSSGTLTIGMGEIGSTKTITAVGCSHNTTAPTSWQSTNITLQSGQVKNFSFVCPGVQGSRLGVIYQGTLWVQYSTVGGGGTVTQQIASIKVGVGASGTPGAPSGSSYVPITITNGQSSGTGSNFQQMVTFSPTAYAQYEAGNLGNIRFYQGATELYSWCEANCTSSSSGKSLFWVAIPSGIGANTNSIINMVFEPNSINYDVNYAGQAPEIAGSSQQTTTATPIQYTSAANSGANVGGGGFSLNAPSSASHYICAGAIASNIMDNPSQ